MADATQTTTIQDGSLTVSSNVMDEAAIRASLAFDPDKSAEPAKDSATKEPDPKALEPKTEPGSDTEAQTTETTEPARDDDGKFRSKSGKPKDDPIARMRAATAKEAAAKAEAQKAREEAAALRARLEALEAKGGAVTAPATAKPDAGGRPRPVYQSYADQPEKYPDPLDAYYEDLADWKAEQKVAQYQADSERRTIYQAFHARVRAFTADHPEMPEVLKTADDAMVGAGFTNGQGLVSWPPAMIEAIVRSERGAEIAHYLGSHPEECVQLAQDFASAPASVATGVRRVLEALLPPREAAAERSTGPVPPSRPRNAPEPLDPVRPGAGTTTAAGPTLMSAKDHADYYNKLEREARRR